MEPEKPNEFEAVKERLEEIARVVDDENLSLDDALDLYEEAVKLGLKASSLLETGIVVEEEPASELESMPGTNPDALVEPDGVPGTNPDAIPAPTPFTAPE